MYLENTKITDINILRDRIWGEVVTPVDPSWDDARAAFNLAVDQQPAAIVFAESAEDVQAAVRFARRNDLRIAPQTTGHNAGPLAPNLNDTVIVRTTRMKGIAIDTEQRSARVQAGTLWGEVTAKLEGTGLAALHGSSPTVGVVGYSLTGGVGWQARLHGMQTNQVTAIDIVDEHGELIRASADVNADLFWALRGAGGNFGVVTAIEFNLVPTPQVNAGILLWPWERSGDVLDTWLSMLPDLPDEFTSNYRIMQMPPLEELPEFLRGRQLVVIDAALIGGRDEADALLAPLRELEPELDTFADVDPSALAFLHMDPPDPLPYETDHMMLDLIDAETARELVAAAGPDSGSPLAVVELRHAGGALARAATDCGARSTVDGDLMYFAIAPVVPELPPEVVQAQFARLREVLAGHNNGSLYLNFTETPRQLAEFFDPRTYKRLQDIKSDYDTGGVFSGNFRFVQN